MNQLVEIIGVVGGKKKVIMYSTNIDMKASLRGKKSLGKLTITASDKAHIDVIRMFNKKNIEVLEMNLDGSMKLQQRVRME